MLLGKIGARTELNRLGKTSCNKMPIKPLTTFTIIPNPDKIET